jgi:hypothetical protein
MIDPKLLIDPQTSLLPAPVWFVQAMKALGFTLHAVPMNLWYAGLLVALGLLVVGGEQGRRFAGRLFRQMPILIALGVNLGIVPLLFVQLAYYKVFYPATILMAWFWLAIIALLIPAYYGVYVYAWGLRNEPDAAGPAGTVPIFASAKMGLSPSSRFRNAATLRTAAGWIAAIFFVVIGFLFANGLSLMEHVGRWPQLWLDHNVAGAATGTALNVGDPTFLPRWLLMFGLALGTTAVWVLIDAVWLARAAADEAYRRWAWGFARKLYTLGMVWAAAAGAWYVFGTWSDDLRKTMFSDWRQPMTIATAVAPGVPWLLMMTAGLCSAKRLTVASIAVAQLGVLGVNAVSRQVVQNENLRPFVDVFAQKTDVQWGPIAMFLGVLVVALAVVGWMVAQVARCKAENYES